MHRVDINGQVAEPENGLIVGNGDLSVSIYQTADTLVWRFGKNDVWDRRLDLSDCPEAAHIDEITRGIVDEKWASHGYVDGGASAEGHVQDVQRMNELCDGWPAYARRPYPCPKPVGELALHLPIDQRGLQIRQRLTIERGVVDIEMRWQSGAGIDLHCFVSPDPNALVVRWKVIDWTDETATDSRPPVWFTLYRWPDPSIDEFAAQLMMRAMNAHNFRACVESGKATPLPPPAVKDICHRAAIEQAFYPDLEFVRGFRYALVPFTDELRIEPCATYGSGWAALQLLPVSDEIAEGALAVAVPTSTDEGDVEGELSRILSLETGLGDCTRMTAAWEDENRRSAQDFWSRSAMATADPLIENTWYEQLHFRRCAYRDDVIAPGLALPSTVQDYSLWHGDYHTNYNYQQPFWGDYAANHVELGDAFFPGMQHMVDLGRRLAAKYWNCRGTFIQLTGYPFPVEDDPYGTGPLARMAYMTGWVANHYWRRYLYLQDATWLRQTGYPVMRDAALFYTDFLEARDDGKYHAFPSLQGEAFYGGDLARFTDQPQVVRQARYCLMTAIEAAELLDADPGLRSEWRERHDNLVVVDDLEALGLTEEEKRRYLANPPEFQGWDVGPGFPRPGDQSQCLQAEPGGRWGYAGSAQVPWQLLIYLHNRAYDPERDHACLRDLILRLRQPNGSLPAMSQQSHGYIGLYGESLGMIAPLQEMMLQSWDGVIRLFPAWPAAIDAEFQTFGPKVPFWSAPPGRTVRFSLPRLPARREDGVASSGRGMPPAVSPTLAAHR
jgi:hypothetical protein